jgi:cytochrome oxidase Cu insertion factor (SCO1/SenC/PrrC family)
MSIVFRLLLVSLLLIPVAAIAQKETAEENELRLAETMRKLDKKYAVYVGMPLGDFSGFTPEGKVVDNSALKGKVSLLLFWFPSLRSSGPVYKGEYLQLGKIPALRGAYPDFQIISMAADTAALTRFRSDNPDVETYTVVNLNSHGNAARLAMVGMPSAILVDRQGNIAHIVHLGKWTDQQAIEDKIRELALR